MPSRMLDYRNIIENKYNDLEVIQFLIYIGNEKLSMKNHIIKTNLNFKYNIIDINNIDCNLLNNDINSAVLSLLTKNGLTSKNITTVFKTLKTIDDLNVRKQELEHLMTVAFSRKSDKITIDRIKALVEDEIMTLDINVKEHGLYILGYRDAKEEALACAQKEAKAALVKARQAIINLYKLKNMPQAEIAEVLGYSLNFVQDCLKNQ